MSCRPLAQGGGESHIGAVADPRGNGGHRGALITQHRPCSLHSQREQVLHRRLTDPLGEAGCEGGARQSDGAAERSQGPRSGWVLVQKPQRSGDVRVAQPGQPARSADTLAVVAQGPDQQSVRQSRHDQVATGLALERLGGQRRDVRSEPCRRLTPDPWHADEVRQAEQRRVVQLPDDERPAHDDSARAGATCPEPGSGCTHRQGEPGFQPTPRLG